MSDFIRKLKKKALLKELKSWSEIMIEYDKLIRQIDDSIEQQTGLSKVEVTRLKQLKSNYLDSYNQALLEAEIIRNKLKALY